MPHRGLSILRASAKDSTGSLQLVWFNQPYIRQSLTVGADYVVDGQLEYRQGGWQMTNPTLYPLEKAPQEILPVYRPIDGVPQGVLRKAVAQVLEASGTLPETLPEAVLQLSLIHI